MQTTFDLGLTEGQVNYALGVFKKELEKSGGGRVGGREQGQVSFPSQLLY
jgi:hypothetical protein